MDRRHLVHFSRLTLKRSAQLTIESNAVLLPGIRRTSFLQMNDSDIFFSDGNFATIFPLSRSEDEESTRHFTSISSTDQIGLAAVIQWCPASSRQWPQFHFTIFTCTTQRSIRCFFRSETDDRPSSDSSSLFLHFHVHFSDRSHHIFECCCCRLHLFVSRSSTNKSIVLHFSPLVLL